MLKWSLQNDGSCILWWKWQFFQSLGSCISYEKHESLLLHCRLIFRAEIICDIRKQCTFRILVYSESVFITLCRLINLPLFNQTDFLDLVKRIFASKIIWIQCFCVFLLSLLNFSCSDFDSYFSDLHWLWILNWDW